MWTLHDAIEESNKQDEIMEEAEIWADMLMEEKKKEAELKAKQTSYSSSKSSYSAPQPAYSKPTTTYTSSNASKKETTNQKPKKKAGFFSRLLVAIYVLCAIFCLMLTISGFIIAEVDTDYIAAFITAALTFLFTRLACKKILKCKNTVEENSHIPAEPPKKPESVITEPAQAEEVIATDPEPEAKEKKESTEKLKTLDFSNPFEDVDVLDITGEIKTATFCHKITDGVNCIISEADDKYYHTHLGCVQNWTAERQEKFTMWKGISIENAEKQGLTMCPHCKEEDEKRTKNDDVLFILNGKEFKHPGYSALNPEYKYRLVAANGKSYHTHLGCYLNWPENYKKGFTHWDVITLDEAKKRGLKECEFCKERERLFSRRRNEILLSDEELIEELKRNHTFEEYKLVKSASASCQEAIDSLSVGDELSFEQDEDCNYQVKYNDEVIGYVPEKTMKKIEKAVENIQDECIFEESLKSYVSELIVSPSTGKYTVKVITLIEDPDSLDRILLNIQEDPDLHYVEDVWY